MHSLPDQIAAIIDPPAWSDREALRRNGRAVLRETERTQKMDKSRRASSLKKARTILEALGAHFTMIAAHSAVPDAQAAVEIEEERAMHDDVRVRRDWIDVRHEYLQADGVWRAGACAKPGLCRECNRHNERPPLPFIANAWTAGMAPLTTARVVIAAHLQIPVKLADDDAQIRATPFTRLRIAHSLEVGLGIEISDDAMMNARTIGEMIALAVTPVEVAG